MPMTILFIELFAPVLLAAVALILFSLRKRAKAADDVIVHERRVSRPTGRVFSQI